MKINRLRLITRYIPFRGPKFSQNMTSMPSCRAMLNGSRVPQRFTSLLPTFERFSAFVVSPPADGGIANSETPYCLLVLFRIFKKFYFVVFFWAIQLSSFNAFIAPSSASSLSRPPANIPVTSLTSSSISLAALEPPCS